MRDTENEIPHAIKPSANPVTLPTESARQATDEIGEGSYSGTRQYQAGLRAYLETANVEKDAHDAAPENDAVKRGMENAEKVGRKPARTGKKKAR